MTTFRQTNLYSSQLPWLILFVILTFAPLHAIIYYIMLASGGIGPWSEAVQYAQAIITEVRRMEHFI